MRRALSAAMGLVTLGEETTVPTAVTLVRLSRLALRVEGEGVRMVSIFRIEFEGAGEVHVEVDGTGHGAEDARGVAVDCVHGEDPIARAVDAGTGR